MDAQTHIIAGRLAEQSGKQEKDAAARQELRQALETQSKAYRQGHDDFREELEAQRQVTERLASKLDVQEEAHNVATGD